MDAADSSRPPGAVFICPLCDNAVEATAGNEPRVVCCPHCGGEVVAPAIDGVCQAAGEGAERPVLGYADGSLTEHRPKFDPGELDGFKIRAVTQQRRSANRSRSYFVILTVAGIGGMLQLLMMAIRHFYVHLPGYAKPIGYIAGALVCALGAVHCWRQAEHYRREAEQPILRDPQVPPDFTPLSDGSQHWKDLEGM